MSMYKFRFTHLHASCSLRNRSLLECKIAAFWQVMILCRGVIYHVPLRKFQCIRNVINHAPTKYHCSKGSISRHEHVQILFCSFVCFVWLNEIVLFEQTEKNRQTLIFCTFKATCAYNANVCSIISYNFIRKAFFSKKFLYLCRKTIENEKPFSEKR